MGGISTCFPQASSSPPGLDPTPDIAVVIIIKIVYGCSRRALFFLPPPLLDTSCKRHSVCLSAVGLLRASGKGRVRQNMGRSEGLFKNACMEEFFCEEVFNGNKALWENCCTITTQCFFWRGKSGQGGCFFVHSWPWQLTCNIVTKKDLPNSKAE